MDAQRFDQIARLLNVTRSRRGAAVLGLAGTLSCISSRAASGKKRGDARCRVIRCKSCHLCRRGRCKPVKNGTTCGVNGECLNGICVEALVS